MKRLGLLWVGVGVLLGGWAWDLQYAASGARDHAFAPPHLVLVAGLLLIAAGAVAEYRRTDDGRAPFLIWTAVTGVGGAGAELVYDLLLWRGVADDVAVTAVSTGVITGSTAAVFLTVLVTLATVFGPERASRAERPASPR